MWRLVLAPLLLWVALDLANPLLPGALSFSVDESVDAASAERVRGASVSAGSPRPAARHLVIGPVVGVARALVSGRRSPRRRHRHPARRPLLVRDASSPKDDH